MQNPITPQSPQTLAVSTAIWDAIIAALEHQVLLEPSAARLVENLKELKVGGPLARIHPSTLTLVHYIDQLSRDVFRAMEDINRDTPKRPEADGHAHDHL